jgi:nicotinamide mononucleotide transporter PnuC
MGKKLFLKLSIKRNKALTWLAIFLLFVVTVCLDYKSPVGWLVFLSVATGFLSCLYAAEGKWVNFIMAIISYAIYIPFCVITKYYGELVTSVIIIVVYTVNLFKWKHHTSAHVVEINKLSSGHLFLVLFLACILTSGYAGILNIFDTEYPILNAICTVSIITALYFSFRISRFDFFAHFIYGASMLILWILAGIEDDIEYILYAIGAVGEMIYAVHGFLYWKKLFEKQHKSDTINP